MADNTSLSFRLFGVDVSASRALKQVGKHAKDTAKDLDGLNTHSSRAGLSVGNLGKGIAGGLGSVAASAVSALSTGFMALSTAVAAAGAAVVKTGIEAASFNEQMAISLETLTGSADKAQGHLKDLLEFSKATPFEMGALAEMDRALLGVGMRVEDVIPYLRLWGDYSSALGLSQEQLTRIVQANVQALGAGRYTLEDLNQIANNGASNIYPLLAEALGKSVVEVRKMATEGKLTADVFNKIYPALQKDYFGNMQKQSQTLSGIWSTLKDTFSQGAADALTRSGFVESIKTMMTQAIPVLTAFFTWLGTTGIPYLTAFGSEFKDRILPSLQIMAALAYENRDLFLQMAQAVLAVTQVLAPLLAISFASFLASMRATVIAVQAIGEAIGWVMKQMANMMDQVAKVPGPWQNTAKSIATSMHAAAASMAADFAAISNPRITVHVAVVRDNSTNGVYGGGGHYEGGTFVKDPARPTPTTTYSNGIPNIAPNLGGLLNGLAGSFGGGGGGGGRGGGGGGGGASARKAAIKRVAADIGKDFRKAILDSRAALVRAFESLMGDLAQAGSKKAKKIAMAARTHLLSLAKSHDSLVKQLTKATQKLKSLREAKADFAKSTRDQISATGNVTNANGTYSGIVYNLRAMVYKARRFGQAIARLRKMGINSTTLRQLLEAGPEEGLAAAESLVNAGKGGVSQVNVLQKQLQSSANSTAKSGAAALYDAGIKAADGLVKGLQKRKGAIEKQMLAIAAAMAKAIKKALGIRSPSRVFMGIGEHIGDGLALGMASKSALVDRTAANLVNAAVSPGFTGYRSPSVQPVAPVVNNFHFPNAVIGNEQHIARVVTDAQKRVAARGIK